MFRSSIIRRDGQGLMEKTTKPTKKKNAKPLSYSNEKGTVNF